MDAGLVTYYVDKIPDYLRVEIIEEKMIDKAWYQSNLMNTSMLNLFNIYYKHCNTSSEPNHECPYCVQRVYFFWQEAKDYLKELADIDVILLNTKTIA